ncbi:NlpC/P60 family protein [Verrucomicrobium sp. GAS474]|uniref:NlpC/P60 family protein n=1 Tax=Verrucomicrobium sp. GAS474 TaxID=1882831 RepID=UPI00087BBD41|nr:NlpC/P60 family protein [Verrucomicrobium sp. GAS474]SDT88895.1 NlpC/P60 family protein [Verrucomicrobium sp. GAS474]
MNSLRRASCWVPVVCGGLAVLFVPLTGAAAEKQATLDAAQLPELTSQPPPVQNLLADALALTAQGLSYKYGSDDPANGGMDCSGTIEYLLKKEGIAAVPRTASDIYAWVRRQELFQAVVSTNPASFELDGLKPGDLLFWTGTYNIDRDPPVTHVMIYLGKVTGKDGKPQRIMFGASEGRYYAGAPRYGVSVFDFDLPGSPPPASYVKGTARFIGYSPVPGLRQVKAKGKAKNETEMAPPAPTLMLAPLPAPAPTEAETTPPAPAPDAPEVSATSKAAPSAAPAPSADAAQGSAAPMP